MPLASLDEKVEVGSWKNEDRSWESRDESLKLKGFTQRRQGAESIRVYFGEWASLQVFAGCAWGDGRRKSEAGRTKTEAGR